MEARLYQPPSGRKPFHFFITNGCPLVAEAALRKVRLNHHSGADVLHCPLEQYTQRRTDSRGLPYLEVDIRFLFVLRALTSYEAVLLTGAPTNLVRWARELTRMDERRLRIYLQTPLEKFSLPKGFNGFRRRRQVIEVPVSYTHLTLPTNREV